MIYKTVLLTYHSLARSIGITTSRGSYKTSPTLSPQSSHQPNGYQRDSYHRTNYRPNSSTKDSTPQDSYQQGTYQQGTYQRGPYQQSSFQQDGSLRETENISLTPKPQIHLQPRKRLPATLFTRSATVETDESMDWSPSYSQHRAFAPTLQPRNGQLFGQAPVDSTTSPFWYKVPPAPITPAHRLRNPPNQPRLRVSSQEVKENFFNNVTRRNPLEPSDQDTSFPGSDKPNYDSHFADQKFFPPTPPSEADTLLADRLTSFSLSSPDDELPARAQQHSILRYVCQCLVLLLGLFGYQFFIHPSEKYNFLLVIMAGCFCIIVRKVYCKIQGY